MTQPKIEPRSKLTFDQIFLLQVAPWQVQLRKDLEASDRICGIDQDRITAKSWNLSFWVTRFDGELHRYSEGIGVNIYQAAMGPSFFAYESMICGAQLLPRRRCVGPAGVFARIGLADCVFTDLDSCLKQVDAAVSLFHSRLEGGQ